MENFIIDVKYKLGYYEFDDTTVLLDALAKSYQGFDAYENKVSLNNIWGIKNSTIVLIKLASQYNEKIYTDTYKVIYNELLENEPETKENVFEKVKNCFERIKYYSYKTIYEMDVQKKCSIDILEINEVTK